MSPPEAERSAEYVEARAVLLDALEALGPHRDAVVLAGAQAIYLRTGPNSLPIAEHTTDGDLALDPDLLEDAPPLGDLMEAAGFELAEPQGAEEPGIWEKSVRIEGVEAKIPIDLIVPAGVAPPGGSRGARLEGHGKRAARKVAGLEAALVDNDVMRIGALDPLDRRRARVRVAGTAALLVAKAHKLKDRIESGREHRLDDKDAADAVRLMQTSAAAAVAKTLMELLDHPAAGPPTAVGVRQLDSLFGIRAGVGIAMASRALRGAVPAARVQGICLAYCEKLRRSLAASGFDLARVSG